MSKRLAIVIAAVIALLVIGGTVAVLASPSAATDTLSVTMAGTVGDGGGSITYDINLTNNTASALGNVYVSASVPTGTTFSSATATPAGAQFAGSTGGVVAWLLNQVPANGKAGPFSFKVTVTKAPAGSTSAWVRWLTPTAGSVTSAAATWQSAVAAGGPRRGCTACHTVIDAQTGKYSLLYEAEVRTAAKGGGREHPKKAPDGTELTTSATVETCLQCHKPGTGSREGRGASAPMSLRDIVHPAHMFSNTFKNNYGGNCFTCHNVNGQGGFDLLGTKVDVSEKGLPLTRPIPGTIPPSEGK